MKNLEIRQRIADARLRGYEVAAAMGIAETSFSRMLARAEMSKERKAEVCKVIEKLAEKE